MSWNRSNGASIAQKKKSGNGNGLVKGAVALVLTVAIGVVVWLMFSTSSSKVEKDDSSSRRLIKEVKPAAAPTNKVEKVVEKREKPYWEQDNTNGFNAAMIRKWKFHRRPKPSITNDVAHSHPKMKCEIFDTYAENTIAVLLTLEPGTSLVGMPRYGEDFEKEFLRSCEVPIIVTKDDDEYTRQLKEDMIATKIELRDRMAQGEKLGDIITESRREAMRLGQIKQDIIDQTREIIRETGANEDDARSYFEAANKLLAEKGITPIRPTIFNMRAILRRAKKGKSRNE